MQLCAVVAAPSLDGEGSCAVIKEALMLGTPVVASDLPGNLEVLGSAGVEVPAADGDALADALAMKLEEAASRKISATLERRQIETWSPGTMAAATLAVYGDLAGSVTLAPEAA
jgi:glycosyltransferase involved in cell wall biosynthesis